MNRALAAGAVCTAFVAVAVLASHHAGETRVSPIRPEGAWSTAWTVGLIGAFAAYLVGYLLLKRRRTSIVAVLVVASAIQLLPLASPLLLSRDVYLYWIFGRIGSVHDGNPYLDSPSEFPDEPAYADTGRDWRGATFPYGPVFAVVAEAHAAVAGDSTDGAVLFYRIVAALLVLGCAAIVGLNARDGPAAAALVGWSPLLAIHFAGGGHNDGFVALPILLAVVWGSRRVVLSSVAWVAAFAVKWVPVVLLPLELIARYRTQRTLGAVALACAGLALWAGAALLYGTNRTAVAASISRQTTDANSISLPYRFMQLFGLPERHAILLAGLLFLGIYAWLVLEAWRGRARLGLAAGALLVFVPWPQPWYVLWPLSLAALEQDRLARVLALTLSAYYLRDALPL